jgi:Holliday junction resolvasome RuvABC endonuclease subunit
MPVLEGSGKTKTVIDVRSVINEFYNAANREALGVERSADNTPIGDKINFIRQNVAGVIIETVHSMPQQGVSSTFTFGKGYGMVIGTIQSMGLPLHFVTPQAWKKTILAGTNKDKAAAIQHVRSIYPNISLRRTERCTTDHDGMADAVCLAEYLAITLRALGH